MERKQGGGAAPARSFERLSEPERGPPKLALPGKSTWREREAQKAAGTPPAEEKKCGYVPPFMRGDIAGGERKESPAGGERVRARRKAKRERSKFVPAAGGAYRPRPPKFALHVE